MGNCTCRGVEKDVKLFSRRYAEGRSSHKDVVTLADDVIDQPETFPMLRLARLTHLLERSKVNRDRQRLFFFPPLSSWSIFDWPATRSTYSAILRSNGPLFIFFPLFLYFGFVYIGSGRGS